MSNYKPHPLRVQRRKGERLKPCECWVGCGRWGNPFEAAEEFAVILSRFLRSDFRGMPNISPDQFSRMSNIACDIGQLRGFKLACFCDLDKPCHSDILAEHANK